jgi:4-hydroxybenzoate polyprenyltransferase
MSTGIENNESEVRAVSRPAEAPGETSSRARRPLPVAVLVLLRPKQWSKNLLVFAALLFTGSFTRPDLALLALIAFAAMCAISSATYIVNDLVDVERDRLHPKKRLRPLAAGEVPKGVAAATAVLLVLAAFGLPLAFLNTSSLALIAAYVLLQILYNGGLKRVPVADVYLIATGFVLRAALGAAAIHVQISAWLLFCTGALALMLGFGKRRNEFILQGETRAESRESLVSYNRAALDALVIMFACAAAICYGIYCIHSQTAQRFPALILTSLFVFYGITRYVLLIFTQDEGGEPADVLFRDRHIVAAVLLFVLSAMLAISGVALPIVEL